ncbi:MAG TPA: S-layer homology domain-containing protein [Acidimicrobiia bacterium]|nr:S-layer homology domain-containing protein [Acidimicrobiia bacterium]
MSHRASAWFLTFLLAILTAVGAGPAVAAETTPGDHRASIVEGDMVVPEPVHRDSGLVAGFSPVESPFAIDPYIAWRDVTMVTGSHTWEVWRCDGAGSPKTLNVSTAASYLNADATDYFEVLSRGRYIPGFTSGSAYQRRLENPDAVIDCLYSNPHGYFESHPNGRGFVGLTELFSGGPLGVGTPGAYYHYGNVWELVEDSRQAVVGDAQTANSTEFREYTTPVVLHEIGHALGWPHVPIHGWGGTYDNPLDIMSGGPVFGSNFALTAMINLYAAGWVDRSEVVQWNGGDTEIRLGTLLSGRANKMIVIPTATQGVFYTVSVEPMSYDSMSPYGVLVHYVDQRSNAGTIGSYCPGFNPTTCTLLSRIVELVPPTGWNRATLPAIGPGGSNVRAANWEVRIVASHADGYTVRLDSSFIDTVGHLFQSEIDQLAAAGITRGCNPPANTRFCPNSSVTRGQMAAFLARALGLPAGSKVFDDTAGHLFQSEIAALEKAGITKGCNPPANTRFCPDRAVTRGEMAAFLVRALALSAGNKVFDDTVGHLFRSEIAALEKAGITRGCNPPANTRFCPDDAVTRGQMAAFLVRAGLTD